MRGKLSGNWTHGTRATYNAGCKGPDGCEDCRRAEAAYRRRHRMRGQRAGFPCMFCDATFATDLGRRRHEGKSHG